MEAFELKLKEQKKLIGKRIKLLKKPQNSEIVNETTITDVIRFPYSHPESGHYINTAGENKAFDKASELISEQFGTESCIYKIVYVANVNPNGGSLPYGLFLREDFEIIA